MANEKGGWVYIITNRPNGVLYTGVTSRYGLKILVWFERHDEIVSAITKEKSIKSWSRADKVRLIIHGNPDWHDLFNGII